MKEGNDRWPPMRQYSVEGTQLDGWNAMIRANEVVPQIQIAAIITPRFEVNYPNVAMHFRPPFPIDTAQTTCFARLPSGSIVEGTPESANGDTDLKFSFPVQTEGTYQFYARIIAADDQRVNRSQWTWKIPADRMFEVGANYPNPFLTTTTIPFMLLKEGHVQADVFSIIGQKVKTLSRDFTVGRHQFRLNLTDFASGVYLVRLHLSSPTGKKNIIKTEKIMRIK